VVVEVVVVEVVVVKVVVVEVVVVEDEEDKVDELESIEVTISVNKLSGIVSTVGVFLEIDGSG
jgi:hypothetical protein